nr:MAG TPA: hypothetical protein [Caudoviricetes sp.]
MVERIGIQSGHRENQPYQTMGKRGSRLYDL